MDDEIRSTTVVTQVAADTASADRANTPTREIGTVRPPRLVDAPLWAIRADVA
jgi:hypothetical protein